MNDLILKRKKLDLILKKNNSLAVAFSGGVDSTFLLAAAKKVFSNSGRLIAVTAASSLHPRDDINSAALFARENNIPHLIVHSREMASDEFIQNSPDRCYICKKLIFKQIYAAAETKGIFTVAHGVNTDDGNDYRPGIKAAEEMNVLAPLAEAGLTKNDIRQLSKEMGLATWNKPSSGCLATRIPYGELITPAKLIRVEAAEKVLRDLNFTHFRVRNYGETAKIEVRSEDIEKLLKPSVRGHIVNEFKKIGFLYVTMDLEDFASGRLNRSVLVQHSGKKGRSEALCKVNKCIK